MKKKPDRDAVFRTFEAVGDGWSWLVLREAILYDVRRFDAFRSRLGIARSTLVARLRTLIEGGLLVQSAGSEYLLTDAGRDFFDCLMVAMRWGDRWDPRRGSSTLQITHKACAAQIGPHFRCTTCSAPIHAGDVHITEPHLRLSAARMPGRRQRAPTHALLSRVRSCSIAHTLGVMGDWWSAMVIRESFFGIHRFDEFQSTLEMATNILANRLAHLVRHRVLRRTPYQKRPVRYEYHLTAKGLDLYSVPLAVIFWGARWKSAETPLALMRHRPCNTPLHAVLSCGGCGAALTREDVQVERLVA